MRQNGNESLGADSPTEPLHGLGATALKPHIPQQVRTDIRERVFRAFLKMVYHGPIRNFFRPRLGKFEQHAPRPLQIPSWYRIAPPESAPTITVVTPSLNQAAWLEGTIQSVLQQGYPDLEYIIQDGGSSDGSIEIIERYKINIAIADSSRDSGQANALNKGFNKSTGEIMAYLNSDDMLLPGTLNYVADFFNRHPGVDVVYGHRVVVDEMGREIGRWILPRHDDYVLQWCDVIPQETLFWKRRIWERIDGRFDEKFHYALDWDLILRFMNAGAKFVRLPRFLGAFRIHRQQKTSSLLDEIGAGEKAILRERCHVGSVSEEEAWWQIRGYLVKHLWYHYLYTLGLLRH
jgi:glycosyltransferase involved in cell wall biosynthesis